MKNLLVIDTSRPVTRLGLCAGDEIKTAQSGQSRQAAQEVLPLMQQLLNEVGMNRHELDGLAVITGPGSFTGLRIGIGVAQGLGTALDIPLLPVSALALQAWSAALQHDCLNCFVVEEAREPEVYFAAYSIDPSKGYELLGNEQVGNADALRQETSSSAQIDPQWVGVGSAWQNPALAEKLKEILCPVRVVSVDYRIEDACTLATLLFKNGAATRDLVLPNYVKEQMDYS